MECFDKMALKFEIIKRVFTMRIPPDRVEDEKKQCWLSYNQFESSLFIVFVSHEDMVCHKFFAMLLETWNLLLVNVSKAFPSGISGCKPRGLG
jgi:hypothetical protein